MPDLIVHLVHPAPIAMPSVDAMVAALLHDFYTATKGKKYARFTTKGEK